MSACKCPKCVDPEVLEREDLDDLAADYPLPDYIEAEEAGW